MVINKALTVHVISDTHNDHDNMILPGGDILIHCGDACNKGNLREGYAFAKWFEKQPYKHKIYVPGNHDSCFRRNNVLVKDIKDMGFIILDDGPLIIDGLRIYGVSKTFSQQYDDDEIRTQAWKNIPNGLDILITHMPPHHILDNNLSGIPCGCNKLLEKVIHCAPKLHVFGHIHEEAGKSLHDAGTTFLNCSSKNRDHTLNSQYYFDISDELI